MLRCEMKKIISEKSINNLLEIIHFIRNDAKFINLIFGTEEQIKFLKQGKPLILGYVINHLMEHNGLYYYY